MRKVPLLILCQFGLLAGLSADVVTLNDGRQVSGLLESGNLEELHIKVGDQSQTIDIHEVQAIQFGVSLAAAVPPPPKAAALAPATPEPAPAQPNSLVLNDGTHVAGRLWSIDASNVHFLVNNQFQHYPRRDVLGVTFGNAILPPPPERPAPLPASSVEPPASAAPPARAPALVRPTPGESASAPPRRVSQPEQIGMVYFWNGKDLTPLEVNQAVEHRSRSTQYWEMSGPQSRVRLNEASSLVFILRLPEGVDPAGYSLFPLVTVNGGRRTRSQSGRRGGLATWPVDIKKNDESSLITYELIVKDLPTGEYSFSPSNSNDGYCFGVDPSTAAQ
jgi:hypothetical protein